MAHFKSTTEEASRDGSAKHSRRAHYAMLFATSGHSGVDRVISNLLPEFASCDVHCDLLTIRNHGPHPVRLPDNVDWRTLPCRHRNTVLFPLIRYLRQNKPRGLLTASHRLNRAALLARRIAGVDMRVAIRMGMSPTAAADALGRRAGKRLLASMRRWYPLADAVIVPSRGVGSDLVRHAGVLEERLHVIPNPLVNARLHEAAAERLDDPWFAADEPPVVLGAGSLEPRKDFATLVHAFARLRTRRHARLVILGRGRERARLEALAQDLGVAGDVRLPGFDSNPYRWMSRAAVFVLCSQREGSGAVLAESLACGTPVVAADCPSGPAEILDGGRVGPLVPVGDAYALADAIERMLDDPPPPERLRAAAEPFRANVSARRYLRAMGLEAETAP
jgi:glycosyltransferase involved in cell wall biosynthesis